MGDELAILLDLLKSFKKAGRLATLTLSPKGSKTTKVKLEVELEDASLSSPPTTTASAPSTSLPSSPDCQAARVRLRPRRSAAKRAKANAWAAQHRAFLALPFPGGDYGATLGPPDPSPPQPRPLHIHPSPQHDSGSRQVITVGREVELPSFSQLDGDPPSPTSPSPVTPSESPDSPPPSPLPPPCFPDRFPRCCHCKGECPCSWGGWCRRCPRRYGTGRPHDCGVQDLGARIHL